MATFTKFQPFTLALGSKKHNLASDQLVVALSNVAPNASDDTLSDITQISYTNCSTRNITTTSFTQTGGTASLVLADLVLTASGAVGPFRYVYIYDDTVAGDPLIAYFDYGSSISLANGETLTIDFDGTNGLFQVA
jgi:hypothetical protein